MTEQINFLADFYNRFINLQMKGTWGYIKPELKERGFTMMTAESTIEEFECTSMTAIDDDGNVLKTPIISGVDKYGRELEIPIDRIISVQFLDTEEQAKLKALTSLRQAYNKIPTDTMNEALRNMVDDNEGRYDKLVAKGVTLYQRRG